MDVTKEQVLAAMRNAAKGHSNKEEVERMMENAAHTPTWCLHQ